MPMTMIVTTTLKVLECPTCAVTYGVPAALIQGIQVRKAPGKESDRWYCPNGHPVVFGQTENDRLKKALTEAQEAANREATLRKQAEARAQEAREALAFQRRRATAGVCPLCHRSFVQVVRHMASKHPGAG